MNVAHFLEMNSEEVPSPSSEDVPFSSAFKKKVELPLKRKTELSDMDDELDVNEKYYDQEFENL